MDKIDELLTRGVEKIYPSKADLEKVLHSGKKLRIYTGIDPTGKLHIGHGVVLRKLRQFQDLGHEIIVLIGDFTARIGDPTDKLATRKKITKTQVEKNAADYKRLIGKILDLKKSNIRFLHNEEWTNKLKPEDMLEIASYFTVSQLLERDMFQERIKAGKEIYVHEFLYPVFQAYDSVTMDVDMEIGGNDQTFNMLAGRTLMKRLKNKEKFVLTTKLLTDPTGKKMGKTQGNIIALDDSPNEIFGKIMSMNDNFVIRGFELLTDVSIQEIQSIEKSVQSNEMSIMNAKKRLAWEIVKLYHGEASANDAKSEFGEVFQKGQAPTDIQEINVGEKVNIIDLLVENKLVKSRGEAKRLLSQNGIELDGKTITDSVINVPKGKKMTLRVGKHKFLGLKS